MSGHRRSMLVPRTDISDHRRTGIRYPCRNDHYFIIKKQIHVSGRYYFCVKEGSSVRCNPSRFRTESLRDSGNQSLPIIVTTISTSLIIAYLLHKVMHVPGNISTLVGVGSSICGGSAIAATAPVIDADDEEVAQAISVIFFFNMLAALFFPSLGALLGFSTKSGEAFGIFAGTAINDTSSVTAAASTWDSLYALGSATLDKAVTVKLTRTLAIIPITLVLAFIRTRSSKAEGKKVEFKKIFPMFILYFVLASVITTIATSTGVSADVFTPLKTLSKFFIVLAMSAVGLNTNIIKLIKTGGKPLALGFCCWIGITIASLSMQHVLGIW